MNYDLEIRIPISPTPHYFRRIHFMAASLRRMQDEVGAHTFVVCVGGDTEPFDLHAAEPWSRNYPIIWHWADREKFRRDSYWETSRDVFRQPTRAQLVMFADADLLFVQPSRRSITRTERRAHGRRRYRARAAGARAFVRRILGETLPGLRRAAAGTDPRIYRLEFHDRGSIHADLFQLWDGARVGERDGNIRWGDSRRGSFCECEFRDIFSTPNCADPCYPKNRPFDLRATVALQFP